MAVVYFGGKRGGARGPEILATTGLTVDVKRRGGVAEAIFGISEVEREKSVLLKKDQKIDGEEGYS